VGNNYRAADAARPNVLLQDVLGVLWRPQQLSPACRVLRVPPIEVLLEEVLDRREAPEVKAAEAQ